MAKQTLKDEPLTEAQLEEFSEVSEDDIIDAQRTVEKFVTNKFINILLIPKEDANANNT